MILERDKQPPAPYVHQSFPAVVYKGHEPATEDKPGKALHKKVNDADELSAALAEGYQQTPPPAGTELLPAPPKPPKPAVTAAEQTQTNARAKK